MTYKSCIQAAHGLVTRYERSIAKAKLAACDNPPAGRLLRSQNEEREVISARESFATVREVNRRQKRIESLVNPGGFMLIDDPKTMGVPSSDSLEKFRAGLQRALEVTDRIADWATDPSLDALSQEDENPQQQIVPPISLLDRDNPVHNTQDNAQAGFFAQYDADLRAFNARYPQRMKQLTALRNLQIEYLRSLPSRDLAWLITLTQGASRGYARWSAELLENDPSMAHARIMAFKEVLLRTGSLLLHGFIRGQGSLLSHVKMSIWEAAKEVMFFEEGGTGLPDGLHMTVMEELRIRLVAEHRETAEKEGLLFDEEDVQPGDVGDHLNGIIAKEVGWSEWKGYPAAKHPFFE